MHGTVNKRKLTVGKIYASLLMLENYRSYKQSITKYGDTRQVMNNNIYNKIKILILIIF